MKPIFFALLLLGNGGCQKKDAPPPAEAQVTAGAGQTLALTVTEQGFEPSPAKVKAGEPLKLIVTRTTEKTCATEIVIEGVTRDLPLNQPVEIAFTPKKTGELKYGCAMGQMVSGVLLVQ